MPGNTDIVVCAHVGEAACTVAVDYSPPAMDQIHVVGTAKTHPKDRPNPIIGETLAAARAFAELSAVLRQRVRLMVEEANSPKYESHVFIDPRGGAL